MSHDIKIKLIPIDEIDFGSAEEVIEWAQAGDLLSCHEAIEDGLRKARRDERAKVLTEIEHARGADFEALLDRSSLGTPDVKAASARTSPDVVDTILRRAAELDREAKAAEEARIRTDEREQLAKRLRKFEGFFSHHPDAAAAREHNVKELRALIAELRGGEVKP